MNSTCAAAQALGPACTETFALTCAQRDIWLDQLSRGDSPLYNIGGYVELEGSLAPELLQRAIEQLVARHDALRTVLLPGAGADGLPMQHFAGHAAVHLPQYDCSQFDDPDSAAQALIQEQMRRSYALDGGPLFRFFLIRLNEQRHFLATQAHHLILDGWGFGQMLKSLGEIYSALLAGQPAPQAAPAYATFVEDDAVYQGSPRHARDLDWWLDKYRSIPAPLLTPRYREAPTLPGQSLVQPFSAGLHERMKQLAGESQASAFHVLLAMLHVYFTRTEQRDEWVVGMPILNRAGARFKSTVGLFAQVSPILMPFGRELSFVELLKGIRDELRQDFRHQRLPLSELNRALGLLREDRAQLFEVTVSYEQDDHDYRYGDALAHTVKVSNRHEPTPLAIHLRSNRYNDRVWIHYVYNEAYFQAADIEALAERLMHVLEQALDNPAAKVAELSITTPAEQAQLDAWNRSEACYPQGLTIDQRVAAQAAERPDAVAAVYQGQSLSYGQLEQRANGLAAQLLAQGVQPDERVAVVARRGLDTLVGLLAVLKAGGAYVPVDPAHPAERLAYLLSDSQPKVVLTLSELVGRLPVLSVPVIELDRLPVAQLNGELTQRATVNNLAYVIYTSGSTGLPKGVMVEHQTLNNLVDWHCQAFELGVGKHTSSLAGFGFDAMAWEIWPALCSGATLHLAPTQDGEQDIEALLDWWRAQPLDVSFLPTPVAEYAFSQQQPHPTLKTLLIGGDRLRQFLRDPGFAVVNNYGPTEATVVATSGVMQVGELLHIGKPMANAKAYVLDEQQQPVPIGVVGELYIGGAGVARGYLNREDLTAERFLTDPFNGGRMYRTGDLVRWLADGNLEYLGRNDDQVKIRGVRVELGEIEAALSSHAAVKDAVAQVHDGQLLTWFTELSPVDPGALHEHLKLCLPAALLPNAYVRMAQWPLTANGKLDRRALPAPDAEALLRREYQAPEGETETVLAALWAELLGVEQVGRQDHFFELGGHSLLAVKLIERMRQQGLSADVQVLFGQPTLANLAAAVGRNREVSVAANRVPADCEHITGDMLALLQLDQANIERIVATVPGGARNVQEIYPLAPLQEGLLYHHMTAGERDPYQQHALFAFASRECFEAFAAALQQVIDRHDILRTSLFWEGLEQPVQVVWREARLSVENLSLDARQGDAQQQLRERFDAARRPLDICRAPMMALAGAEDVQQGRWLGLLQFHHLINDATSTAVLMAEIHALLQGAGATLSAPVPYRNYVAQAGAGNHQAGHEVFFREWLGDIDEPTLAFDLRERPLDDRDHQEARAWLDQRLAERLRHEARHWGVSPASLYHLAWAQVLSLLAGRDDVVFGTVLLGRLLAGDGADRAMGMFINTLPLRVKLAGQSVSRAAVDVHGRLAALLAHEHAPLAQVLRCSALTGSTPLFNSLLNYRHAANQDEAKLPGIELLSSTEVVSYALMLAVDDTDGGFRLSARVPRQIGAQRVLDYLRTAIEGLVQALECEPHKPLHQVAVTPDHEVRRWWLDYNATATDWPIEQGVQTLFEAQVRRTPEAIALQAADRSLSYAQLNVEANRLAHRLIALGVKPDQRVALCVERGVELVVGLLGILKAGGAYVPLDPGYPAERLDYMLRDSAPVALLVHAATRAQLSLHELPRLDFDQCDWQQHPDSNPQPVGFSAANLAYMIYTSGSTGTPKGVMIEHRGLCNLVHWGSQLIPPRPDAALLQKAPFSFDGSVWEFFWPLTAGLRLVLAAPDGHRDPDYLVREVRQRRISVVKFVPALLQQFLDAEGVEQCTSLIDVVCGGGELTASLARQVRERLPQVRLHNVYGPTEATVDSSAFTLEPHMPLPDNALPIGCPLPNTRAYVLDAHDRPVPQGVSGQLHVGGVGVARGYKGLSQHNAERFIASPFVAGDRLYRTGDLVRMEADGNLVFLGRNDFQVKLHGLRLELGEIEARLMQHVALHEVVVLLREQRLVAYFTLLAGHCAPGIEALRAHVLEQLPDYMTPSAFVCLPVMPLSPNGKVERKALPEPGQDAVLSRDYRAPEGDTQTTLARIWAQLLGVERVGRDDNFFELGGHSLLAVTLVARMRQAGLHADARALFSHPTLADLALHTRHEAQQPQVIPATTIPSLNRKRRI
ncbi:amino acid adenylation domain-containing protein [Pseudomonas sp. 21LCFQ02]|uniref:non-ribosomal peptide synthetase n=1 Tax=Pseudomonas sp. 21LCFQ02 TaxID=2957505 RepID=UPI00209B55E6|nr:non-ribosomal peptide synthetase [Pseudomonas sp. 21LCFQ02]MCO8171536.1 amino acid adenylation domain-containing protein [Pseudomonas sp. 21LCFQ02]